MAGVGGAGNELSANTASAGTVNVLDVEVGEAASGASAWESDAIEAENATGLADEADLASILPLDLGGGVGSRCEWNASLGGVVVDTGAADDPAVSLAAGGTLVVEASSASRSEAGSDGSAEVGGQELGRSGEWLGDGDRRGDEDGLGEGELVELVFSVRGGAEVAVLDSAGTAIAAAGGGSVEASLARRGAQLARVALSLVQLAECKSSLLPVGGGEVGRDGLADDGSAHDHSEGLHLDVVDLDLLEESG